MRRGKKFSNDSGGRDRLNGGLLSVHLSCALRGLLVWMWEKFHWKQGIFSFQIWISILGLLLTTELLLIVTLLCEINENLALLSLMHNLSMCVSLSGILWCGLTLLNQHRFESIR